MSFRPFPTDVIPTALRRAVLLLLLAGGVGGPSPSWAQESRGEPEAGAAEEARPGAEAETGNRPLAAGPALVRLHLLPTAALPSPGEFQLDVGQTTTFGGGVAEGGAGSGNQTYQLRADVGLTSRLGAFFLFEDNDDPTWDRIDGVRYRKEFWYMGGGLRLGLLDGSRVGLAMEGSLAGFGLKSDAGLFTVEGGFQREHYLVSSLSASLDWHLLDGWTATLSPALLMPPENTGGRPFLGRSALLGAGFRGRLSPRWLIFATGDLPLGPGHNHLDDDFRFRRVPIYSAGAVFAVSPQLQLTGYLTNGAGGTSVTRHMTLLGSVPAQAGLRLKWAPSQPPASARRDRGLPGSVTLTGDQRSGRTLLVTLGLADVFDLEAGMVWTPGRVAGPRLGLELGGGGEYRVGGRVALLPGEGSGSVSLAARLSVGRSLETSQGYLVAELRAETGLGAGASLSLSPTVARNGGETPVGLEAGVEVPLFRDAVGFVRALALLTPQPTPWTAGLRIPAPGGFTLTGSVSTAQSPLGIGRFLSVGDEPRVGLGLNWAW